MISPKEKAQELYNKYSVYNVNGKSIMKIGPEVKVFTLIAVDEQIELLLNISPHMAFPEQVKHLQKVKQEIETI